jgi:arginase
MKKVYINSQWQGGADLAAFNGANEIIRLYMNGQDYTNLSVSTDKTEAAVKKNGIKGFDVLRKQMKSACGQLQNDAPDKLFTLGGGCDADVPGIVYLCEKYQGDLTLIWLDAHGDLNTPEESVSSLFYGMPLHSLMDETCFGLLENRFPLHASQIIHVGGRDFDDAEKSFIKESGLFNLSVQDIRTDCESIFRVAREIGSGHIYIHLDLDVIDPTDFPNTPLPVDGGLNCDEVWSILGMFADMLAGLGIYEYAPSGTRNAFIEKLIRFGLAL